MTPSRKTDGLDAAARAAYAMPKDAAILALNHACNPWSNMRITAPNHQDRTLSGMAATQAGNK